MRRLLRQMSVVLVLQMSFMLVAQPLAVEAADCAAEKAAVDALAKDIQRLNDAIQNELRKQQAAKDAMKADLAQIDKIQKVLDGEAPLVQHELDTKGAWAAAKTAGLAALITLALGAIGPEGWPLLSETSVALLEVLDKALTVKETAELYTKANEYSSMMEEMAARQGSLDELLKFAEENNLTEMQLMLEHLANLAALMKSFDLHWKDLKDAVHAVAGDQALMDKLAQQYLAALEAYYACLQKPGPEPSPCEEGVATNPNGAGVCR